MHRTKGHTGNSSPRKDRRTPQEALETGWPKGPKSPKPKGSTIFPPLPDLRLFFWPRSSISTLHCPPNCKPFGAECAPTWAGDAQIAPSCFSARRGPASGRLFCYFLARSCGFSRVTPCRDSMSSSAPGRATAASEHVQCTPSSSRQASHPSWPSVVWPASSPPDGHSHIQTKCRLVTTIVLRCSATDVDRSEALRNAAGPTPAQEPRSRRSLRRCERRKRMLRRVVGD
jgi:hypothetical protein